MIAVLSLAMHGSIALQRLVQLSHEDVGEINSAKPVLKDRDDGAV